MNKRRFFAMILALIMSISCLSLTASAEANPPSDDVIIWTSEPTESQETRPVETAPPPTEPDEEPEEKTSPAAIVAVLLLIGLLGAMAFFFLKGKIPNTQAKGATNLDDYDYGIEDDEEYAEFEEYEDEEAT